MSTKVLKVDLPGEIFDAAVNIPLMHQVVVAQQAAARQGTASTKTRGDVRGGGRKPHKQKGTGRARQGSTRAPQFAGGGVVHGPHPRSYAQRTPKKMKAAALRSALSDRARDGRIHVVDSLVTGESPSTKAALAALSGIVERHNFLVVLERADAVTWLSLRNAPWVHIVAVDQLNTYDVLLTDDVVFTQGAYDAFVGGTAAASARPATVVEAPAVDAVDAVEDEPAKPVKKAPAKKAAAKKVAQPAVETEAPAVVGFAAVPDDDFETAAQPGDDGAAPEGGYEIKGNKDSMKYHEPGGRWYDATIAEVWFKTEADAEAAGFVKAGSKESIEASHADDAEDDK